MNESEETTEGKRLRDLEAFFVSAKPNFFSLKLSGKDLDELNSSGKKTANFQCEFFAVQVALSLWRDQLMNRQVKFYIDNDGVTDVLISCSTSEQSFGIGRNSGHPLGSLELHLRVTSLTTHQGENCKGRLPGRFC